MSIDVKVEGLERNQVLAILLKEIDERVQRLQNRPYYREDDRNVLSDSRLPAKARKALESLKLIDEEARVIQLKRERAKERLVLALGPSGVVGTLRAQGWSRFVVRETDQMAHDRMHGTAERRRNAVRQLDELKSRMLMAAVGSGDLAPFVEALGKIGAQ